MKKLTHEWVEKAEGDFVTASREMRSRKSPNYDAACFHAQQRVEKYVKGRLHEAGTPVPKIHDLNQLLNLVSAAEPGWSRYMIAFKKLTSYAILYRYPGFNAVRLEAIEAMKTCRESRKEARNRLGIR